MAQRRREQKRNLHVRISVDAFEGLRELADQLGVSLTAVVETGGLRAHTIAKHEDQFPEFAQMARQVDRKNRSRVVKKKRA